MCGIAGIISKKNKTIPVEIVENMIAKMKHRGPDDEGFYCYNQVALGHSRLSIIDISGGHQPMFSEDKNLVLIFNGEIYNYIELQKMLEKKGYHFKSHSDSEVLIHMYEEYQEGMLQYLNGMFAFAIYNKKNNALFVARDRVGVKPLYWYEDDHYFIFASEIEAFRSIGKIKNNLDIDINALWHYFSLLYIPPPLTIYKQIHVFEPGTYILFTNQTKKKAIYWKPEIKPNENLDFNTCVENLDSLINSSVKLRMQSDVPYGAYLSGGVDSSLVVSKMIQHSGTVVKTFNARIMASELDESMYAKYAADHFHTEHLTLAMDELDFELAQNIFRYIGQPFADSSLLPTYAISKKIKEYITVVLGGDGGDEFFSGYDKYNFFTDDSITDEKIVKKAFINRVPEGINEQLFKKEFIDTLEYKDTFDFLKSHQYNKNYQGYELLRFLDIQFFLQGDILSKLDSMSMAHSLEAREPLLDYRIIEFALTLPKQFLVTPKGNKYLLKAILEKYVDKKFVHRQKVGFILPIAVWLRKYNKNYFFENISPTLQKIISKPYLKEVVEKFYQGDNALGNTLFAIHMFSFWEHYTLQI